MLRKELSAIFSPKTIFLFPRPKTFRHVESMKLVNPFFFHRCFAKYPDNVKDFFKSAMPDGYIQERTISFENDGAYQVRGVVTYEHGSIYNRVTLKGEGFKKDGLILRKQYEFCCPNNTVYVLPDKENNGLRVVYNKVSFIFFVQFCITHYL